MSEVLRCFSLFERALKHDVKNPCDFWLAPNSVCASQFKYCTFISTVANHFVLAIYINFLRRFLTSSFRDSWDKKIRCCRRVCLRCPRNNFTKVVRYEMLTAVTILGCDAMKPTRILPNFLINVCKLNVERNRRVLIWNTIPALTRRCWGKRQNPLSRQFTFCSLSEPFEYEARIAGQATARFDMRSEFWDKFKVTFYILKTYYLCICLHSLCCLSDHAFVCKPRNLFRSTWSLLVLTSSSSVRYDFTWDTGSLFSWFSSLSCWLQWLYLEIRQNHGLLNHYLLTIHHLCTLFRSWWYYRLS